MKTQSIKLSEIRFDAGTQSRASINEDVVAEYAERMKAGDKFPPADVFADGNEFYMADGFHRGLAANRMGMKSFPCVIHKGTVADALWFAIGANGTNGAQRTPADKRRAIELALAKFPDKTQKEIAAHVGCGQQYVSTLQRELTHMRKLTLPKKRKGKDGKSYPSQYKHREPESEPEPEPEPENESFVFPTSKGKTDVYRPTEIPKHNLIEEFENEIAGTVERFKDLVEKRDWPKLATVLESQIKTFG